MSTFKTALKFAQAVGARGACLICLIVNPPLQLRHILYIYLKAIYFIWYNCYQCSNMVAVHVVAL